MNTTPCVAPPRWERFADTVAQSYHRHLVPAIFQPWGEELIALADPRPGQRVLYEAWGTGVLARLATRHTGAEHVTGLDINPGMLTVARPLPPSEPSRGCTAMPCTCPSPTRRHDHR